MATKAELEAALAAKEAELEAFKRRVRDRVDRAMDDGEICRDGGEKALREWGLTSTKYLEMNYAIDLRIYQEAPAGYDEDDNDTYPEIPAALLDAIEELCRHWPRVGFGEVLCEEAGAVWSDEVDADFLVGHPDNRPGVFVQGHSGAVVGERHLMDTMDALTRNRGSDPPRVAIKDLPR